MFVVELVDGDVVVILKFVVWGIKLFCLIGCWVDVIFDGIGWVLFVVWLGDGGVDVIFVKVICGIEICLVDCWVDVGVEVICCCFDVVFMENFLVGV